MAGSMFSMGFRSSPFMGTPGMVNLVGTPVMLSLTYDQIKNQGWRPLLQAGAVPGFATIFPYVIKLVDGSGEFLVYADGTAQWTRYGSGHVGAPFRIK